MKNGIYLLLLLTIFFTSCYSKKQAILSGQPHTDQIDWPENYQPSESKFFVHNELFIQASAESVWDILIHGESWPEWYEGAQDVKITNSDKGLIEAQSVILWKTMGMDFESTIKEFEPYERLSWESVRGNIQGYHAWLIIPQNDGVLMVTDEAQHGWLTFFEKIFQPHKLRKLHDVWLSEIKKKAEEEHLSGK